MIDDALLLDEFRRGWHAPQSTAELCGAAEDLCRRLAPLDLAGVPVYVLAQSELPETFRTGDFACWGYTDARLDLTLHDAIGERWQGRGAALVVQDRDVARAMREDGFPAYTFRRHFYRIVVHELAHVLELGFHRVQEPAPDAAAIAARRDELQAALSSYRERPSCGPRATVPHFQHEAGFTRAALHLAMRARRLGMDLMLDGLCAGQTFCLSDPREYLRALGDEPERLADAPIAEVLATRMPADYVELLITDVQAQQRNREQAA